MIFEKTTVLALLSASGWAAWSLVRAIRERRKDRQMDAILREFGADAYNRVRHHDDPLGECRRRFVPIRVATSLPWVFLVRSEVTDLAAAGPEVVYGREFDCGVFAAMHPGREMLPPPDEIMADFDRAVPVVDGPSDPWRGRSAIL